MGNDATQYACNKNDNDEQHRYQAHGLGNCDEQVKECKNNEHVRQINFIAVLTDSQQRTQYARTPPLAVSTKSDEHARTNREDAHIQPIPAETQAITLERKSQHKDHKSSTKEANYPTQATGDRESRDDERRKAA